MASPALLHFLPRFGVAAAVVSALGLAGCQLQNTQDTLPPVAGVQPIKGLAKNVSVRRNAQGMPLIESNTFHDALFSLGYVHASDRITQMVTLRLLAQGRLAEMSGPQVLDVDRFMRAVNLKKSAGELYNASSPRLKRFFEVYARGVNAYLFRYRDKLPTDLAQSGYKPEYWKPEDSALLFCLLNFSQSSNLQEELSALVLAQKVGVDKLAWLTPSAPDEPVPLAEADKLKGVNLSQITGLAGLETVGQQLRSLNALGVTTSSNWAIGPQRSRSGKSLLANDIAAQPQAPSPWNYVQIRAPKYQAVGASIAGLPTLLSGFNGKVAWSMSAVKGDTQDLFLEKVKRQGNALYYENNGKWLPAGVRNETFFIKGQRSIREVVYETRHGALLNSSQALTSGLGLALQTADFKDDKSLDAFFDLSRAQNAGKASDATREIRAIALNMIFADASNIGWQVTGRFPNRREGEGLLPSPGWDTRFDWDGYADAMLHPYDQDPAQGWIGTANQRTAPRGYGMQLSNAWDAPERNERLAQLANAGKHDSRSLIAMQYDQTTLFAAKLKGMFQAPGMAQPLKQAIEALPAAERAKAREALERLMAFDGRLATTSADAAIYELFLQESARQIFLDKLGPENSASWKAFVSNASLSYSAIADHLLGREDSPFWDDTRTPQKEDKPAILARTLAAAITTGDSQLGADHKAWQWGKLHSTTWKNTSGQVLRGPFASGGDHNTLNPAPYSWGQDFNATQVSALRMIIDFGQAEPMMGQGGIGQSGNPASPNYVSGIDPSLKAQYLSFPMQPQNFEKVYGKTRLTLTPGK
ncbi:penicillin acylase family protein [Pseudomonas sp. CFSAN084952]|uniref:penicillin acylase family protein n=1 Tax=Pseudomonas TaxID=286 RepID=UPI0003DBAA14|nr:MULTISPECIES: penicillin acylase family protein [unclassified Pseudomonas]ETK40098.1 acyl-homoserine lactone acylase subunit beta [Pseudomonas fluorescens FH5]MBS6083523.1 penicillin acylase family protein [Pseudomonas fluorescens]PTT09491.1 penicillin acylase family protein [Pseudomonas sp. HMWF034]PVV72336.1 penicillin acylase family protein [Pseudomonas sp. HMWF011]QGF92295.1 penicillin acylase family protein [Pseudomonas sp. CFSAN084952]